MTPSVKDKYMGFIEGAGEALNNSVKDVYNLLKGFGPGVVGMVAGGDIRKLRYN